MEIMLMAVVKKMLNDLSRYGLLLLVVFSLFISFPSNSLAVNYGSGLYNSGLYSATIPLTTASPIAGAYNTTQSITLTAVGSESIRYSTTEIPATCSSGTIYSTPILISNSQTIYARSCDNFGNSSVSTFVYTINSSRSGSRPIPQVIQNGVVAINMPVIINNQTVPGTIASDIQKIKKILKLNSKGSDVKILQQFLIDQNKGTKAKSLKSHGATNNFGQLTKQALIEWQKANGLKADGIFGPKSSGFINNLAHSAATR